MRGPAGAPARPGAARHRGGVYAGVALADGALVAGRVDQKPHVWLPGLGWTTTFDQLPTSDDHLVSSAAHGTVCLWTLPAAAARSPREARAWLDELSSVELGDAERREPACR